VRFTHNGIDEFVEYCQQTYAQTTRYGASDAKFKHIKLPLAAGQEVLARTPMGSLPINNNRVSFFVSAPGLYYPPHKDGVNTRVSINYTVKVLDTKCVTSWYSEQDLEDYAPDTVMPYIRGITGFVKENHTALKSMTAVANECILFNTDIYHAWDNTESANERIVLTLRLSPPGDWYFEDVKKILFN
jgi:hypothetical protein